MEVDLSNFTIPADTPISRLECRTAFEGLEEREKLYAHFLSRASWNGGLVCLLQTSPESAPLFLLLKELFSRQTVESLKAATSELVSEDEFQALLLYAAAFFCNMGNYKSFGDTKFVPALAKDKFEAVLGVSALGQSEPDLLKQLWGSVSPAVYSLSPHQRQLGFMDEGGTTTYYSSNCSKSDAALVQKFMTDKHLEPYNTRLFKTVSQEGKILYEVRLASSISSDEQDGEGDEVAAILGAHEYQGVTIAVTRGDYAPLMQRMVDSLQQAKEYACNEHEVAMLKGYIQSFRTGSVTAHKDGSRHWIKDKGPVVETYIGFIETYRDPFGVRAEFEGFVAVVNKAMSAKFAQLVDRAEAFLPHLPWPPAFEKDRFLRPDFTSLDVLTYACSGIPAGINIPNYDEVRQNEGFKNVSLGNVLSSSAQDKRVSFLSQEDQVLFTSLRGPAFEVQVGLHELLGHGSGKLFIKDENGQFNFDMDAVRNPLTNEKVASWYSAGETWDSKFSSLASPYEECKAECVGLYLCTVKEILSIFGHTESDADDVSYVNWLNMVRAGVLALEFYTPENKKWRQAHMQARYVILQVLLENTKGLVSIDRITDEKGAPDIIIKLDRQRIESEGRPAIGEFLKKLQVLKSVANVEDAASLFGHYSAVTEEKGGWLSLRDIVLARKIPRRMFVQSLTSLEGEQVFLEEFSPSAEGIVAFFTKCYPTYDKELEQLWKKDNGFWVDRVD